ncbi:sulfurtransferase [Novosphingobium album (ex Liu et al. 2023)]|uniref:Sulfurtransferase n=1 Tax=Novosphingobium album (ex Liu et al. 2023) TaxID=3031130 RepID=A0ABT5WNY3_9SPHN|nr:sulfurtransferase [Novosphingobium album (ex Liu et al. 2023)]MDE8651584.1 sulfurtransferase [Novosphingobium album (ex Liu et al. 2023)]
MAWTTIIPATALHDLIGQGAPVLVLDCEFDLGDPARGRSVYRAGHIPGARYVHLDDDMSARPDGSNGRHPLPDPAALAARLRALGLHRGQQVVAYDGNGGFYAARLWWMLRWLGHEAVAVLDGGRQAWLAEGFVLESDDPAPVAEGDFTIAPALVGGVVSADEVLANIARGDLLVVDARDPARFAGAPHPLDTVSGHIPGARNRFLRDNFDATGKFKLPAELAREFAMVLGETPPDKAVMQCGSGVTACANALAMEIAGLKGAKLYPGSWSEWTSDPARPVATGQA